MTENVFTTRGGLRAVIDPLLEEIRELYLADPSPWIVGYSGGKDSTAILQLVWAAVGALKPEQRMKPIHVISTDTMVENPVVAGWVARSHAAMEQAAKAQGMPIRTHRLHPTLEDSFWVNLIGRGYPAPRPKFRWCTERLKIKPSNAFIIDLIRKHGEAILVLGTRKAESALRARTMTRHEAMRVRDRLSPNASLAGCQIYSPIEAWSNDDVWLYLNQVKNPWDWSNQELMGMYAGATSGGECPLVVDTSTPSCGDSRFGCWVCTLVDKDKSMGAMIQNDVEKEWMLPLLDLRNHLDPRDNEGFRNDTASRDFRRINGSLTLDQTPRETPVTNRDKAKGARQARERHESFVATRREHVYENDTTRFLVHGPYLQSWREDFLFRVLQAQAWIQGNAKHMQDFTLISLDELNEIRRIWVLVKGEIEDSLPGIYQRAIGSEFPGAPLDEHRPFGAEELALLRESCGYDPSADPTSAPQQEARLHYEMARKLLEVEHGFRAMARRAGLFPEIEEVIDAHAFTGEADALAFAIRRKQAQEAGREAADVQAQQQSMVILDDPILTGDAEFVDASETSVDSGVIA